MILILLHLDILDNIRLRIQKYTLKIIENKDNYIEIENIFNKCFHRKYVLPFSKNIQNSILNNIKQILNKDPNYLFHYFNNLLDYLEIYSRIDFIHLYTPFNLELIYKINKNNQQYYPLDMFMDGLELDIFHYLTIYHFYFLKSDYELTNLDKNK